MSYTYITINNYFLPPNNVMDYPLSNPCPTDGYTGVSVNAHKLMETFKKYPLESLTAGTVTIGSRKVLRMSYVEQVQEIKKCLLKYDKTHKGQYIAFMEATKSQVPHLHMLIYNGYQSVFVKAFQSLGSHNKHTKSFCPVSDYEAYAEYIMKEYNRSKSFYTNIVSFANP